VFPYKQLGGNRMAVQKTQTTQREFLRCAGETLLVALFFYSYGAPVFDPVRPEVLTQPLAKYRLAVNTVATGQGLLLKEPLINITRPIEKRIVETYSITKEMSGL